MLIRDFSLQFSFFVLYLSGFGAEGILASESEFRSIPYSSVFWKHFRRIGVVSSLNIL